MATKSKKGPVTNEKIFGLLLDMDERITNMDERIIEIKENMATKDDLERQKEEIIDPIVKAVDKDAKTIFDHGKRIVVLERKAGVAVAH